MSHFLCIVILHLNQIKDQGHQSLYDDRVVYVVRHLAVPDLLAQVSDELLTWKLLSSLLLDCFVEDLGTLIDELLLWVFFFLLIAKVKV